MKMNTLTASLAVASLFFTACKKDTESAATFTYRLQTTNRSAAVQRTVQTARTQAAAIQWTSGTATASELKFEAEANGKEIEHKQKTTQAFDLFAASSTLGNLTIPAGTYNEVEFKAYLAPAGSSPALMLAGNFIAGNTNAPVQFVVNEAVELKAEKHNISVAEGNAYSALNTLDLSALTTGITGLTLTNATKTNGVVVLSASSNTALYNIMLSNLQSHHGEAEIEHH